MVDRRLSAPAGNERGSALATVVVVAGVLFLLLGITYIYFTMNASSGSFRMNRLKALTAAEAGVALTLHDLSSSDTLSGGSEPRVMAFGDDTSSVYELPGTGSFICVADPMASFHGRWSNGAVEIRSRGTSGEIDLDLHARAAPAYPSSFALLTGDGIPRGFFTDGREVNGPVHSNGIIYFESLTADSSDDPIVESISTCADGGFFFTGAGLGLTPHPQGSTVWVRPYAQHSRGLPTWDPFSKPVDFQRMNSYFRELASTPHGGEVVRIDAERVLLDGERMAYKRFEDDQEHYESLDGVSLVIIGNGFSSVWLKGSSIPDHSLTILSTGDLVLGGSVDGGAPSAGGPLGLVSMGDIIVPVDPELSTGRDWQGRWDTETEGSLSVRACVVIPNGTLKAENPTLPRGENRLTVSGSLAEESMGTLAAGTGGYQLGISWSTDLMTIHPPMFPLTGRWNIFSWTPEVIDDDPDMIYEDRF